MSLRTLAACLAAAILFAAVAHAQPPARTPVLLDTDFGCGADDAFALAFLLGSEEVELPGITAVGAPGEERATMLCRFLSMTGRRSLPLAVTSGAEQVERPLGPLYQYYYHPDALFGRTKKPEETPVAEFLYARIKGAPQQVTLLALGPLTQAAELLAKHGDAAELLGRIVVLEENLPLDPAASRAVFASGAPLTVVLREAAAGLRLEPAEVRRLFSPGTTLSRQVQCLHELSGEERPPLAAVLAAAVCFRDEGVAFAERRLSVDERGALAADESASAVRVATQADRAAFIPWYVERMAGLRRPAETPAAVLPPDGFPSRIHVVEDYETDIERRWWLVGRPETERLAADAAPPGRRAWRSALTHDFDDLLGSGREMQQAVVFNPVPGPPLGPRTRLRFRYRLHGTDRLRVQIYTLSRGYHRHLVLTDLPQDEWRLATVDMTAARRADGTGGALAEDERIDDIQFYADPDAELLIDDVCLYDAPADGETRPFPRRIHFTGWFDTGRQGGEWPGRFEIVPAEGARWKAAQAIELDDLGPRALAIGLRGERRVGPSVILTVRYRLTGVAEAGPDALAVSLARAGEQAGRALQADGPFVAGEWATARFTLPEGAGDEGLSVDEIRIAAPAEAELVVDDLLLFEP